MVSHTIQPPTLFTIINVIILSLPIDLAAPKKMQTQMSNEPIQMKQTQWLTHRRKTEAHAYLRKCMEDSTGHANIYTPDFSITLAA